MNCLLCDQMLYLSDFPGRYHFKYFCKNLYCKLSKINFVIGEHPDTGFWVYVDHNLCIGIKEGLITVYEFNNDICCWDPISFPNIWKSPLELTNSKIRYRVKKIIKKAKLLRAFK